MNLTVQHFRDQVIGWVHENTDRIRVVWPLAGGWEAWAQAEIAGHINRHVAEAFIDREPPVYLDGSRADLLINNPFQNDASELIVVEMKCESLRNWRAFVDGLRYDAWKLQGAMRMGLGASKKMVIGLFFSPESEEQLAELTGFEIIYPRDREGVGIAILYL
ncbi:hypothetical protein [Phenylobacterium sp.]|uniref:hypothetical protein n=1 Tax=Phenylobacterium sp. TaxID=1871053 RepID=UPI003567498D